MISNIFLCVCSSGNSNDSTKPILSKGGRTPTCGISPAEQRSFILCYFWLANFSLRKTINLNTPTNTSQDGWILNVQGVLNPKQGIWTRNSYWFKTISEIELVWKLFQWNGSIIQLPLLWLPFHSPGLPLFLTSGAPFNCCHLLFAHLS